MSLTEIITLVAAIIATVATVVQAWVAWRAYKKSHPSQATELIIPNSTLVWLTVVLLDSALFGLLSASSTEAMAIALASTLALALDEGWATSLGMTLSVAWMPVWMFTSPLAKALANTSDLGYSTLFTIFWLGTFMFPFFNAVNLGALVYFLKSFSKFYTFLIFLGTSWLGLALGWLAYPMLYPMLYEIIPSLPPN